MENFTVELVNILQYLLPGFVTAWLFHSFTSYNKSSQFERIIQALIFTILIQAIVSVIKFFLLLIGKFYSLLSWDNNSNTIWSIIVAIIIGIVFSFYANNDKFHKRLRDLGITKESSYPSEWFGAFLNVTYIVLHLEDKRRIYGWPREWPSEPENGYFVLEDASWLDGTTNISIEGIDSIMINAKDVKIVEFMKKIWE